MIGRNELFEWLRKYNYVCKKSTNPTKISLRQKLMGATSAIVNGKTVTTPYITGKGLNKFYNKYTEENHITKAPPLF